MTSHAIVGVFIVVAGLGIIGWGLGKASSSLKAIPQGGTGLTAYEPPASDTPTVAPAAPPAPAPTVPVVRMATIIGGVFWGMMLFSLVGAIFWLIVSHLPG